MRTYRELFRTPEFTPLFLTTSGQVAAQTVSGLALSTLMYKATGSPLLSALAMFGPSLAQVIGATTLLSGADRLPPPPRAALTGMALIFGLSTAAQAIPGLPVWTVFAILLGQGMIASLGGGVSFGLLNEILPSDGYVLGRSMFSMSSGIMQICGFAFGGVLTATLSPRRALLIGAGLYLIAAVVTRSGLSHRPPRTAGLPSATETWRNNARLWSSKPRRYVYLAFWVPSGLIVGCESLYVAYSPRYAGLLFACGALGMLFGDILTGRYLPQRYRARLGVPLLLLLAAPYLIFVLRPALPFAMAAVVFATVGYSANWVLQERLLAMTPAELSGQALGLHFSGMRTMQGVGAALAGAVAQYTSPSTAMAVISAAAVVVTLVLVPGLRPDHRRNSPDGADPAVVPEQLREGAA
ncbi:MFS transporter [Streptomyces sp. NPDC003032]